MSVAKPLTFDQLVALEPRLKELADEYRKDNTPLSLFDGKDP